MIITGTPSAIDEPQRQSILINMVSKYSLINSKKVSGRVYPQAPISDIVSKILSDPSGLNIPKSQQFIDKTINDDKVSCNHDSPLEVITGLCKNQSHMLRDYQTQHQDIFSLRQNQDFILNQSTN